ncbi:hypothetical protein MATL_G00035780 [Megalops atlanticus]|uniref:Ig-like domain-containing protein n=1 Tax=Megalops atlanticus TaxID=7932 RepID=A0A9D3QFS2_MEGAT|nr:hypothetical protein MATL_G00035780 [Megalops atlanticus]
MKATQKDYWYFMVLVILLGFMKDAIQDKPADSIVKLKDSITLECVCPWSGNLSMISWMKMPQKKHIAVFHPEFGVALADEYAGRVGFLRSSPMDGSISINNTSANDTGLYHCSMQTFPKGSWTKDILVKESVDINPTTPYSEVVEMGSTFTLRCNYVDNGTVYQVTFEKVGNRSIDIIALCNVVDGSFVGADYRERVAVNCHDVLDVSLQLMNVTEEDGGLYRCHFSSDAGDQTMTVSVTVPREDSSISPLQMNHMYIYIGGGVSGFVLLTVVITSVCWYRRKNRRARSRAKQHPIQRRPFNNYEQAAVYDRMNKLTKHLEDNAVYVNVQSLPRHTKRKT